MKKIKTQNKINLSDKQIANFLFEVGMLAKTPRSGFHFLGTGEQSVAEHVNRTSFIGYALAMMDGTVDVGKVLKMIFTLTTHFPTGRCVFFLQKGWD